MLEKNKLLTRAVVAIFALLVIVYVIQGVRSAYRFYPSNLGYQVRAFDVTPRWIGTKNLLYFRIDPYSEQGSDLIEEAFFGRPLKPEDEGIVKDRQHFAYPLHVIFLYAPTVVMSFPNALLVIWIAGFLMYIASVWIWFKLTGLNKVAYFFALIAFFLTWPQMYIGLQARQPLIVVFFLISLGVYLIVCGKKKTSYIVAGIVLFLSTVKPQNSLIPVAYLLILWLPSMGDKYRTESVWLGFLGMSVVSLILTQWLVPGWVGEFLQGLSDYRGYAGTTGAESLWGKGMVSVSMSILFVIAAMAIGIGSYRVSRYEVHLIVFSYLLILQGLVFPSHLYTVMMGIPLTVLSLDRLIRGFDKPNKFLTYVTPVILILVFYAVYRYWIHIFSEAPLPNDLKDLFVAVKNYMPIVPLYAPFPLMLVLGIILFMETISESTGKFSFKKIAYFRR